MTIVLAIDQFDNGNNGTTISARNLAESLRKRGHEVRVLGIGESGEGKFSLPELKAPIATQLAHVQGMAFAKPVKETMQKAFEGADIVHFYMPFLPLATKGRQLAESMGIATTAAFHVQPENITYNCGLASSHLAADFIYNFFKKRYYNNKYTHVHCPSNFIANELTKHGYTSKLHVVSNGVADCFTYSKTQKSENMQDKFNILMVGRLSKEKRQDLLIEAAAISKYSDKIQLHFAGNGPKKKKYVKMSEKLKNAPSFGFYSKEELRSLMSQCDLYVHTADIEIEAISCIEAFSTGLVPIISNSKRSATNSFVLDKRSLFLAGNPKSLAEKIDYWIEHPQERAKMEVNYSEHGKQFALPHCAEQMEKMFSEAIEENKERIHARGDCAEATI